MKSQILYLIASHLIEYLYCPRFTYYEYVLSIGQSEEKQFKVVKGRDIHEERQKVNSGYLRKKLGGVKKEQDFIPQLTPVNAMINYAYGVLYSKVERGCIIAGLDPYVGFLHTDRYNKKSLVFDLIEPFRIFADRVVLKLFTGRKCRESMFRKDSSSAIVLEKSAKELLITRLNDYLEESVRYKIKSSKTGKTRQIKRRDTIQAEAHSLANAIIGKNIDDIPKVTEIGELFD